MNGRKRMAAFDLTEVLPRDGECSSKLAIETTKGVARHSRTSVRQ
jgi:hypothetical protein